MITSDICIVLLTASITGFGNGIRIVDSQEIGIFRDFFF